MRLSKWQIALVTCGLAGIYAVLDYLQSVDPSRGTSHLAGGALLIATLPLIRWRLARFFQVWTIGWLFGDIVFRNMFGPVAPIRTDAGAWRGVLALAYAAILILIALYDGAIRRAQPQGVGSEPA